MPELSFLTAFLTGLLGGAHCVGMCGGIVAAMSFQTGQRQSLSFHLAYNLGRMVSYAAAGAIAGLLGSAAFLTQALLPLQQGIYILAQVVLILLGLYLAGLSQTVLILENLGGTLWRRLQPLLGRLLPITSLPRALAAGALWGWLPCGLVYSVLVVALASGGAVQGGLYLLAFALGTLPNLMAMGWAAERLRFWTRARGFRLVAGLTVAALGVWGLFQFLAGR